MYFGVGAEKAASTWIAQYLIDHPQVGGGARRKGYLYFTSLYPTGGPNPRELFPKYVPDALLPFVALRRAQVRPPGTNKWLARFNAWTKPRPYVEVVRADRPCRAFGEMSPLYSVLTAEAYAAMRAAHPRTRFFFVMREPVDRLWSAVRMGIRKDREKLVRLDEAGLVKWLDTMHDDFFYWGRADYTRTITELEKAVPREDILYLFFEDLFTERSMRRFTDHLGIDYVPFSVQKEHAGVGKLPPAGWSERARGVLDPIYRFVEERFGDEVPASWLTDRNRARMASGAARGDSRGMAEG
jgi:Sulfotransferase family